MIRYAGSARICVRALHPDPHPLMTIAYDRAGAGTPLVLIHPLGGDRRVWEPVRERLGRERDVIALDLPGFGESPPLPGTPTPSALAQAVARFLDGLGIDRPHVAGNSLGGWVALELGLAGRARSVGAIAPAGLWPEPLGPKTGIARRLARGTLPVVPLVARWPAGRRALLGSVVARPDRVPPAAATHLVRGYTTAPGFVATNAAMRAATFRGLERVRAPVTLAWPEHDRLVARPAYLPPAVHNRVLRGCGHVPMWDEPEHVANLLLEASASTRGG
jgi:pimeloyl-ACP methyl ester carboxylesterase